MISLLSRIFNKTVRNPKKYDHISCPTKKNLILIMREQKGSIDLVLYKTCILKW